MRVYCDQPMKIIKWAIDEVDQLSSENWSYLLDIFINADKWENNNVDINFIKIAVKKSLVCRSITWIIKIISKNPLIPIEVLQNKDVLDTICKLEDERKRLDSK